MERNRFVVFEGLSGAGKSTVARLVAERMSAVFYTTPSVPFATIRDEVDAGCQLTARYFFYLASVVHASSAIAELLKTTSVVCDRYILTTQCYHRAAGVSPTVPSEWLDILQPTLTVFVGCAEVERRRRLTQRGLSHNDREEIRLSLDTAMLAEYEEHRMFRLDTTDITPAQAAAMVVEKLASR